MTEGWLFDYGGTLDTGGQHWGKVLWHAYERRHMPVTEQQFREAYVHAERTLGKNPIIRPDDTFRKTLETKVRLQLAFLGVEDDDSLQTLVDDVYAIAVQQTARSREVLLQLKSQCPLVLVSNFYGNLSVVLREFGLDGLFETVVESAVVGVRKPDPRIFLLGAEALGLPPSKVTAVGAQCNHVVHVNTQLPYALLVASVSFVAYIAAPFIGSPALSLSLAILLMFATLVVLKALMEHRGE